LGVGKTLNKIASQYFGKLPQGQVVSVFELSNANGIKVSILNYGGIVQSIKMPDRKGMLTDIVLGFDDLHGYVKDMSCHGAVVGRFANRIAGGQFNLKGAPYKLDCNDGDNCLHGGSIGFNRALWKPHILSDGQLETLRLTHTSPHGDQGFPGELKAVAAYTLTEDNVLRVESSATTDRTTVVSMTLHPYFNLTGDSQNNILEHILTLHADEFLPIKDSLIPEGHFESVSDTPSDFRRGQRLGEYINADHRQLKLAGGYDHCFVQRREGLDPGFFAELYDPSSGRKVKLRSNAPGLQLYTGNFLSESILGKYRRTLRPRGGICLEPQEFPNSPNEPAFCLKELEPGDSYDHTISFQFEAR
jgi:aldose 1-epimerase